MLHIWPVNCISLMYSDVNLEELTTSFLSSQSLSSVPLIQQNCMLGLNLQGRNYTSSTSLSGNKFRKGVNTCKNRNRNIKKQLLIHERAIPFISIFPLPMFKCTLCSATKERANDLDAHPPDGINVKLHTLQFQNIGAGGGGTTLRAE